MECVRIRLGSARCGDGFVVRHFRWLARIPLLPQIFDALETAATRLSGVLPARRRFGGFSFIREGCELAPLRGDGLLDMKLTESPKRKG